MSEKRKLMIITILTVMIIALSGIGAYYWFNNTYFVMTEDAKITGDLVKVSPQISAKLLEFNSDEGDLVIHDQILGRQEMGSLPESSIEQSVIRAPISGIIIKKQCNIGEFVTNGQSLAMIVDPSKLYITANIEETKLGKVHPGQKVDISIDQFEGVRFSGTVHFIGEASNSTFSLLPTSTGGTFTKVVQKIPVKIEFNTQNIKLLPGTNSVVKIHIK